MKSRLDAWTFLRPLLLAVAAAASWIALCAAGASADSSTPGDPLLGTGPAALASVISTHPVPGVQEPVESGLVGAPAAPPPVALPPLSPVVEDVTAVTDDVVQAVPTATTVVPAGAVAAVVDPAVGTVDGVIGATVGTVVPLADEVLATLVPVLEPAINAVPLPVPVAPEPTTAMPLRTGVHVPSAGTAVPPQPTEIAAGTAGSALASLPGIRPLPETLYAGGRACDPRIDAAGPPLLSGADPQSPPFPEPVNPQPGMPGAATGGGSTSGSNGSAMPAWLGTHHLQVPAAGAAAVRSSSATPPAPVSYDPGSSPD